MIVNGLIYILQAIVNVLLAPLNVLNFVIDISFAIPVVKDFISVVSYLMPFDKLVPLFAIVFGVFVFRGIVALIRTIWDLLPVL